MNDNVTTMVGHIALMVVSVCNLVATLLNRRKIRRLDTQLNGRGRYSQSK